MNKELNRPSPQSTNKNNYRCDGKSIDANNAAWFQRLKWYLHSHIYLRCCWWVSFCEMKWFSASTELLCSVNPDACIVVLASQGRPFLPPSSDNCGTCIGNHRLGQCPLERNISPAGLILQHALWSGETFSCWQRERTFRQELIEINMGDEINNSPGRLNSVKPTRVNVFWGII